MKERPILFSAQMVRALIEGRKTMTRRVVKPQPPEGTIGMYVEETIDFSAKTEWWYTEYLDNGRKWTDGGLTKCPYGTIGDRLWVRETWAPHPQDSSTVFYRATVDAEPGIRVWDGPWKPSIHMPSWASRITLEITDIRVERAWDITRDDAMEEGVERVDPYNITPDLPPGMPACWKDYVRKGWLTSPMESFRTLWDSINSKRAPWASNPWVWVIEFGRAK